MPSLEIQTITPQRAAEILAMNVNNRNVRKAAVATYSRDMAAGNWRLTGAPLVLNGDRLLDGQHRLLACVSAAVPFETAVMYGVDEEIHFAIDKGIKRTVSDELRWRGESDVHNLSAALSLLWKYENGTLMDPRMEASTSEIIAFLDERTALSASIKQAQKVRRQAPFPLPALAVVDFQIRSLHGEEIADVFIGKLASGADLVDGDPLLVLRNYAVNVAASRQMRPRREEWLAIIIKGANHWLLGRPIKFLRWRRVGPTAESFPTLIGPEEAS